MDRQFFVSVVKIQIRKQPSWVNHMLSSFLKSLNISFLRVIRNEPLWKRFTVEIRSLRKPFSEYRCFKNL